jgi:glycine/D-amino acid oxidase-like deaminating enzyme
LRAAEQLRNEVATLVFTPDRLVVVKGGPAARRAYFDRVLGRLSPARAGLSAEYGAAVGQRNAALRRVAQGASSREALAPWNEQVSRLGAELVEGRRVERLEELGEDVVVVTAGAWAKALLAAAGIDLPVRATSETLCYYRLATDRPVPSIVDFKPDGLGHGTYALADPVHGLKLGIHQSGRPLDPDDPPGPDPGLVELMRQAAARYFPTAETEPADVDTCLYTNTDDERFILERHGRIVVGSACSGHGFKFAPVVGERLADLVLDR